jgi:hypothetical protein
LKEEALDRTLWRTRFGRGYGPIVRQTTEWKHTILKCPVFNYHSTSASWSVHPCSVNTIYFWRWQHG